MQQSGSGARVTPWGLGVWGVTVLLGGAALMFALERLVRHGAAGRHGLFIALGAMLYGIGLTLPVRGLLRGPRQVLRGLHVRVSRRRAAFSTGIDGVTGLANRSWFVHRLNLALGRLSACREDGFSVLLLDLDRFKLVNDALGHSAGDDLLRQVAARINAALRPDRHLVARLGGDEFAVLLEGVAEPGAAERIAARIQEAIDAPYRVRGHETRMTASVGIIRSEQCIACADSVLRDVDTAMYGAKRSGPGRVATFAPHMRRKASRDFGIETELRKAIGTAQLSLLYQPIVALDRLTADSVEALVRWNHPRFGIVNPEEFIPIAEQSGLVIPLDEWVQRQACLQWRAWQDRDAERAPRSVSVNVSRVQMAYPEAFLAHIRAVMEAARMPPGALRLEVTERDVMRDPDAAVDLLRELRKLGVGLAMDDFGTGMSSLACLRRYPFDVVKIDRDFIADLGSAADVRAVVHASVMLIESLGMRSVAEGVENAGQVEFLRSIGCHSAQGYLFGRPAPADRIVAREPLPGEREAASPLVSSRR